MAPLGFAPGGAFLWGVGAWGVSGFRAGAGERAWVKTHMPDHLPNPRGKLMRREALAPFTWFRVGGPAQALFLPADEADLAAFLEALAPDWPIHVLGLGSNLIVRDGGVDGLVVRLTGRAFAGLDILEGGRIRAGAGALDAAIARFAAQVGLAGLEFLSGIPGSLGGALAMNAGCYGREIKDVLISARAMDRFGAIRTLDNADFGFVYRGNGLEESLIFLDAILQGQPEESGAITARMQEIKARREAAQPIREKTGGSTFRNPPGHSAWALIDAAGQRGARLGGAMVSPKHCNFLINTGEASAADIEGLGEAVRAAVLSHSGVDLHWEIKRIGNFAGA